MYALWLTIITVPFDYRHKISTRVYSIWYLVVDEISCHLEAYLRDQEKLGLYTFKWYDNSTAPDTRT